MSTLTDRQRREREYYDEYSRRFPPSSVDFSLIDSDDRRPWNSYWFVYDCILDSRPLGRRLLEIGCGTGESAILCARAGYDVHAFDISRNNIEVAHKLAVKYEYDKQIHLTVQAAEQLDYPSGFFDIVLGIDILHHINVERSIMEVARVLRPGGVAIFREHIEVPIFDWIRNTSLVRSLRPKEKSFEQHITEDERKLNRSDLTTIRNAFDKFTVHRFRLAERFTAVLPSSRRLAAALEKIDQRLFRYIPSLRDFGGSVVLIGRRGPTPK